MQKQGIFDPTTYSALTAAQAVPNAALDIVDLFRQSNLLILILFQLFSVESGEKDLQDLAQYHVDYDIIITWITTNQKRLQDVKDDDSKDRESIEKQRVILKVFVIILICSPSRCIQCYSEGNLN